MKDKIHPQYKECTIVCACGEIIQTRSTKQSIRVDICSKCHPFYTGQQKLLDSAGMVEKFKKRYDGKVKERKEKKIRTKQKEEKENSSGLENSQEKNPADKTD